MDVSGVGCEKGVEGGGDGVDSVVVDRGGGGVGWRGRG